LNLLHRISDLVVREAPGLDTNITNLIKRPSLQFIIFILSFILVDQYLQVP
jgi:hypothetical protein